MQQLLDCRHTLESRYGPITNFATPYGSYNDQVISAIKDVYSSHRNVKGVIADGISDLDINLESTFDPYSIVGVTIRKDTTIEQLKALVDYAAARNAWLVLTYHQAETGDSQYSTTDKSLNEQMKYLSRTPYKIVTIQQALNSLPKSSGVR